MKGNPMKEKVVLTMSLICLIGIIWLSSSNQSTNSNLAISEDSIVSPFENSPQKYLDDVVPENTNVEDIVAERYFSVVKTCSLKPIESNALTFGNAFKYYRECLGPDSNFQWNGSAYSTLLANEVIIQVADSVLIKDADDNNEMTETR